MREYPNNEYFIKYKTYSSSSFKDSCIFIFAHTGNEAVEKLKEEIYLKNKDMETIVRFQEIVLITKL